MVNQHYAPRKDIRQMIDAVHNACVELWECGDLMLAGECDDLPLAEQYEMLRTLADVCQLAGRLGQHYLEGFQEIERTKQIKRMQRTGGRHVKRMADEHLDNHDEAT